MIVNVTDADYGRQAQGVTGPLVVVFGTFDDLGSMVLDPVLARVDQKLNGRIPIVVADVAACPKAAAAWGVGENLPVILILRSGVLERVLHGVRSERRLLADIDEVLREQ
ncbi:hypothetical protein [Glycomyces arizonensis]|uniref:hypothetical protein n=1 Tax=Glycomyces arizonensis TaxID=256035 RepID=UPI000400E663|nr:hypothetical protein [Glycomyces arizonensis]